MNTLDREFRQSIWSVRPGLVGLYFALFTLSMLVGTALIVRHEITVVTTDSAHQTWIVIMQDVALLGLTSAIVIFTLTEIMEYTMVMANWFRQQYLEPLEERRRKEREQRRKEARAEGREEGRAEGREEGEREALARIKSEMQKRGIELSEEDEEAIFTSNGHSQ